MSAAKKGTNRVEQKQHQDGKQIADLESAVHRLKQQVENQGLGKAKNYQQTLGKVVSLMGSKERFEAQYLLTLGDCEVFAARVPPGIATGYVPVDLYRKTIYAEPVTGADDNGYICISDDVWGFGQYALLAAPGVPTYPVSYSSLTANNYATILASGGALAGTGVVNGGMQDVSPNFVSDPNDGTEYMQVASITTLTCQMTPNALADEAFVGRAHVIFSLDPERYSLNLKSLDTLKQLATEQDAQVFIRTFQITRDGLFVPEDREDYLVVGEGPTQAFASISSIAIPVHNDAYTWKRIGGVTLASNATTFVTRPSQCIFLEAPTGTKFQARTTYLWQTEEYPTNRVTGGMTGWQMGQLENLGQSLGHAFGAPPRAAPKTRSAKLMLNVATGHATEPTGRPTSGVRQRRLQNVSPKQKPKHRLAGSDSSSNPQPAVSEARPSSMSKFVPHVFRNLGSRPHPAAPALSVLADRAENVPGLHAQMAANPIAALKDFLPINELTKSICGMGGGPSAVEKVDEDPAWWESLLSGASTAMSFIGPLLAML